MESQKNCPIDLKDAISSVIFASPRCADIPELMEARKHFLAKYGKEFIAAALELRPDSGVNHTIIEKLSAKAPDGETKIKILTAIAQEHNVKWDPPGALTEPSEDLLNGPSKFTSASKMSVESPSVQFQPPHSPKRQPSTKFSDYDVRRSSPSSDTFHSVNTNTHTTSIATTSRPEQRVSESRTEWGEFRDSFSEGENTYLNRQNWNMEFKDATSAAQAAAESAEIASFAARAAAELSRQNSTGSVKRSSRSFSSQSNLSSIANDTSVANLQNIDRFSRKNSSEVETINLNHQRNNGKGDFHGERSIKKQSSWPASSHTSASSVNYDDVSYPTRKYENDATGNFSIGTEQGKTQAGTKESSFSNYPVAVFDEPDSDSEGYLDIGSHNNGKHSDSYFPTQGINLSSRLSSNIDPWSSKQQRSGSLLRDSSSVPLHFVTKAQPPAQFPETLKIGKDTRFSNDLGHESGNGLSHESERELNFESLRGGLRNKSFSHLPYIRGPSGDTSLPSIQQTVGKTPNIIEKPVFPLEKTSAQSKAHGRDLYSQKSHLKGHKELSSSNSKTYFDSDSDDGDELQSRQNIGNQEFYNQKPYINVHKELSSKNLKTYFEPDNDVDESQNIIGSKGFRGGMSRRARDSPSETPTGSFSRVSGCSEASNAHDFGVGSKTSAPSSFSKPVTQKVILRNKENSMSSAVAQPSKPLPQTGISLPKETVKSSEPSSAVEHPSMRKPNTVISGTSESPKPSSGVSTSRENSLKRLSHVHPKLPDYDTLSAHMESLRTNRR
ncbi:uncharacterized protein LOC143846152 isoform X2 [Tasmannia lanceolata]